MVKQRTQSDRHHQQLLRLLRELRQRLGEINSKLDHLIRSYRQNVVTSEFDHSSRSEFND